MNNNSADNAVTISTNAKTLAAVDSGVIQNLTVDATTITLPAMSSALVGATYMVRVKGPQPSANGTVGSTQNKALGFTLAPNSADSITGGGLATPVVNKGFAYAKTTSRVGDFVKIVGTGVTGVGAWFVTSSLGTFTRVP